MSELNRTSGRYRMSEEDKAKQVPLKLSPEYLEKLNYLPGKTTAEKIRNLIDKSCEFHDRERRQIREVERLIPSLHQRGKSLVNPELKSNEGQWQKEKEKFLIGLTTLESLIDILHLDFKSLKENLNPGLYSSLEVIFFIKNSL